MKLTDDITKMLLSELGRKGGLARAKKLTPKRRREIARLGGQAFARGKKARA